MGKSNDATLREDEIRPDELMKGERKHIAADRRRLLRHRDEFVHVSCPACGTDAPHKAFDKEGLAYVVCSNCATMYVNPRPTLAILEKCYAKSRVYWYWNKYIFLASEESRRDKVLRPRVERIADICQRYSIENRA